MTPKGFPTIPLDTWIRLGESRKPSTLSGWHPLKYRHIGEETTYAHTWTPGSGATKHGTASTVLESCWQKRGERARVSRNSKHRIHILLSIKPYLQHTNQGDKGLDHDHICSWMVVCHQFTPKDNHPSGCEPQTSIVHARYSFRSSQHTSFPSV